MSKPKDRFFIIGFSGLGENAVLRSGKLEYKTVTGKYVNEVAIIASITKSFDLEQVFIKSVQELNESDFMDYIEGREDGSQKTIGDGGGESFL